MTLLEQKELILKQLNRVMEILEIRKTDSYKAFEILEVEFSAINKSENVTITIKPFGTFELRLCLYSFWRPDYSAEMITDIIEDVTKKYPKLLPKSKESSYKVYDCPKSSTFCLDKKAISMKSVDNILAEIELIKTEVLNAKIPAIKQAYAERLAYMEKVLKAAAWVDFEVELNPELQGLENIIVFGEVISKRQILDAHKDYNIAITDMINAYNVTANYLLLTKYEGFDKYKERLINDIETLKKSMKTKYFMKNYPDILKSLRGSENVAYHYDKEKLYRLNCNLDTLNDLVIL